MGIWAVIGNVLWIVWGSGIVCFVFWCLAGVLAAITVIGLPLTGEMSSKYSPLVGATHWPPM